MNRRDLLKCLDKPLPPHKEQLGDEQYFDPWVDVIHGISGDYSSESDGLMIGALIAVRDGTTHVFMKERGFAGELALYILAGHGLIEYGVSPRFGWPEPEIADRWQDLIDKWEDYVRVAWSE